MIVCSKCEVNLRVNENVSWHFFANDSIDY